MQKLINTPIYFGQQETKMNYSDLPKQGERIQKRKKWQITGKKRLRLLLDTER